MHNGHLYPLGWYLSQAGTAHHIVGMAQHSESGAFYMLDATKPDDWQLIDVSTFGSQNHQGNGPAFKLIEPTKGGVHVLASDVPAGTYQHFKGRTYTVYGTATLPDGSKMVLYRPTYGQQILMLRPLEMFTEQVDKPEISYSGPRFWRVGS